MQLNKEEKMTKGLRWSMYTIILYFLSILILVPTILMDVKFIFIIISVVLLLLISRSLSKKIISFIKDAALYKLYITAKTLEESIKNKKL